MKVIPCTVFRVFGAEERSSSSKTKNCNLCSKAFANKSNLLRHQKTYKGDERYACPQCQKSSNRSDTYKSHVLIHTGKSLLRAHNAAIRPMQLLKHSGEKPYRCTHVNTELLHLAIWQVTHGSILEKRDIFAQFATIPVKELVIWKFIWWGNMQKKSPTGVTSVTTQVSIQVPWEHTWWFTLERNYSSANGGKNPSNGERSWQDIPRCI